jgi:hypothetical protein
VDIPLADGLHLHRQLADADAVPLAVSDDAVIHLLGAAFGRAPLSSEGLRDAKLAAFLLDVDSGRLAAHRLPQPIQTGPTGRVLERLASLAGMSIVRARMAITRLTDAGVLEAACESAGGRLQFSSASLRPAGIPQFVDWIAVLGVLVGRAPALSVLRASMDLMRIPGEWTRLTYEMLALHACYSVGMAQRGMGQLLSAGVVERSVHAGRGHDYRLTSWALGRGLRTHSPTAVVTAPDAEQYLGRVVSKAKVPIASPGVKTALATDAGTMVVELGGLVVRIPAGTEIRMIVGADGVAVYELGPDLRISRRA